jgi:hypothetical protein
VPADLCLAVKSLLEPPHASVNLAYPADWFMSFKETKLGREGQEFGRVFILQKHLHPQRLEVPPLLSTRKRASPEERSTGLPLNLDPRKAWHLCYLSLIQSP